MCVTAKSCLTVLRAEFAAGRICVPNLRPRYFPVKGWGPGAKRATDNKSLVFCSRKSELWKSNCTQHENHGIPLRIYMLPTFFGDVGVISGCGCFCARGIP